MAQTKKDGVREAILAASLRAVLGRRLQRDSIPAIAARGRHLDRERVSSISTRSSTSLHAVRALAERPPRSPWALAGTGRRATRTPRSACSCLWRELPRESNGFANNVMQALSTTARRRRLQPAPARPVPGSRGRLDRRLPRLTLRESQAIAGVVLMAFDGFAMNVHLPVGVVCDTATARLMARTIIGT